MIPTDRPLAHYHAEISPLPVPNRELALAQRVAATQPVNQLTARRAVRRKSDGGPMPPFERVVKNHYQGLYRFALSLSRKEEDAVDLVQQCFLIFARKGQQIRDSSKVKSWLFTTLYREFLALKRKRDRFSGAELEEIRDEPALQAEDRIDRQVDARIVLDAIEALDPIFRDPLILFYVDDCSYKEIADILDLPQGTVMSRLSRGKVALRKRLRILEKSSIPLTRTF